MAKNGVRYNDKNMILVSMCLYLYVVLHIFFISIPIQSIYKLSAIYKKSAS